jgi:hypothetical protein
MGSISPVEFNLLFIFVWDFWASWASFHIVSGFCVWLPCLVMLACLWDWLVRCSALLLPFSLLSVHGVNTLGLATCRAGWLQRMITRCVLFWSLGPFTLLLYFLWSLLWIQWLCHLGHAYSFCHFYDQFPDWALLVVRLELVLFLILSSWLRLVLFSMWYIFFEWRAKLLNR